MTKSTITVFEPSPIALNLPVTLGGSNIIMRIFSSINNMAIAVDKKANEMATDNLTETAVGVVKPMYSLNEICLSFLKRNTMNGINVKIVI